MIIEVRNKMLEHRNQVNAIAMSNYMRNQFSFLGIKTPMRKEIGKKLDKQFGFQKLNWEYIIALWNEEEREMQYLAIDHIIKYYKNLVIEDIEKIENLITTKSWWDTVDLLATWAVGQVFRQESDLKEAFLTKWVMSKNIWLIRTSIIFQLKYGKNTDFELLIKNILMHDDSKEFFIQKGAGWALREYAKKYPEAVLHFLEINPQISPLSRREAIRNIVKL